MFPARVFRDEERVAQPLPYMALKDAPVEVRRAATVAQVSSGFTRGLGILFTTLIIATLPTWVPGILAYQTIPVALLALAIGSVIVSRKGSRIREEIAERQFQKARSSTFITAILGFVIAGILPGILYLYLYTRIGDVMVKRTPDDPKTVYLLPHPSEGIFLGRYLGWIAAYLLVLYIGYTQLSPGLRQVSDWLSPVLGVHFNTMIVALFLVFTNPHKPNGHPRHHTDDDQKRRPSLRRSHDLRSRSLSLLARRRVRPQDTLENDQDKENGTSTEQHTEEGNSPTRTRNLSIRPKPTLRSAINNHPSSTWQTLPAKPGNRTRHARRSKRQPTNDKPRPLQQRPRPRQQLRRKQPLTLHNQQQLLTTPRRQLVSRHTKLHPRTILTTRPDHILHRRPSDHPDRI